MLLLFSVLRKLISTKNLQNRIVVKDIVNALMENWIVLKRFAKVRKSSPDNIKKEIAFNLFEDLKLHFFFC